MSILERNESVFGEEFNQKSWVIFQKERRNVILLSLFLSLYKFVGFSLEEVSMVGNTIPVENPERMIWIVWAMWSWTLFRYYLYFRRVNDRGFLRTVNERVARLTTGEMILEHWRGTPEGQQLVQDLEDISHKSPEYEAYVSKLDSAVFGIPYYVAATTFQETGLDATSSEGSDFAYIHNRHENVDGKLDVGQSILIRSRSIVGAMFNETEFSEFYFPAVASVLPVAVLILNLLLNG